MNETLNTSIGAFVRNREHNFTSGRKTKLSKHVDFSLRDHINQVEAYRYSKHISGATDSLRREKPFFNISTSVSNIWYRATDIDRRNVRIKATNEKTMLPAFVATQHLQKFMRTEDFGTFLNKWGKTLADYGSAVSKHVEKDGKLHNVIVPWNRLLVDPIGFDNDAVIEIIYTTPDKLLTNPAYDKEAVKRLIDAREEREDTDGQDVDGKDDFIKLYEVHGQLPKSLRTGKKEDMYEYEQQMFILSFNAKRDGTMEEFCLVKAREDKSPYMIAHLIEEEGRVMGIGAFEHVFEAQWMSNHTAKQIKDNIDLTSLVIMQTMDDTFMGQNALSSIQTGDIMVHANNAPLTRVQMGANDINNLQAYGQQWENLAKEITSTPDAIRGDTMPSGTAYRSVAIQNRESHSLFELMTENKGLALERMMRTFILPWIKKQMNTKEEMALTLDAAGVKFIDSRFIPYEAEKRTKEAVKSALLNEGINGLPNVDPNQIISEVQSELNELGNTRFIKPSDINDQKWADALNELVWDLEVEVTNENTDKEATLTTLTTVLQTIAGNPQILQDDQMRQIFNDILEESGRISPVQLGTSPNLTPSQAPIANPQPAPQPT